MLFRANARGVRALTVAILSMGVLSAASGAEPANRAPQCDSVSVTPDTLWPVNHKKRSLQVSGIDDPDGDQLDITTVCIRQDEPRNGRGMATINRMGSALAPLLPKCAPNVAAGATAGSIISIFVPATAAAGPV